MMRLVDRATGNPVQIGDTLVDFHGDTARLTAIREPHDPRSTGRVVVREGAHTREYFPGVFGLIWEGRDDQG
jgi:hypothetical protein